MRTTMLVVLCLTTIVLFIAVGLEGTTCSIEQKREMLKKTCAHYRRKRGFAYSESLEKPNRHHRHRQGWYDRNSVIDHQDNFEVVANDTSGGILIRHRRRSLLMYCCTTLKNCSQHFTC